MMDWRERLARPAKPYRPLPSAFTGSFGGPPKSISSEAGWESAGVKKCRAHDGRQNKQ